MQVLWLWNHNSKADQWLVGTRPRRHVRGKKMSLRVVKCFWIRQSSLSVIRGKCHQSLFWLLMIRFIDIPYTLYWFHQNNWTNDRRNPDCNGLRLFRPGRSGRIDWFKWLNGNESGCRQHSFHSAQLRIKEDQPNVCIPIAEDKCPWGKQVDWTNP
jgi:hypothetical protein